MEGRRASGGRSLLRPPQAAVKLPSNSGKVRQGHFFPAEQSRPNWQMMKNSPLITSVEFCSSHEWVPPIGGYGQSNDGYRQLSTPIDGYRQSKTKAPFRYNRGSLRPLLRSP